MDTNGKLKMNIIISVKGVEKELNIAGIELNQVLKSVVSVVWRNTKKSLSTDKTLNSIRTHIIAYPHVSTISHMVPSERLALLRSLEGDQPRRIKCQYRDGWRADRDTQIQAQNRGISPPSYPSIQDPHK